MNSVATLKAAAQEGSRLTPHMLANYCDLLLKKSTKVADSQLGLDAVLDRVLIIFNFLEDTDVFQKFYSKHLASRLVKGESSSEDAEESMISKLKSRCGAEWTRKFQTMFHDVRGSF
jgi:cullin 1